MKAMILAAGRGERLRPLTDHTPKPLLKAAGKPLIEYTVEALVRAGFTDIVINLAHLGVQIKHYLADGHRYGAEIRYSEEGSSGLETAGGIQHALPLLGTQPFLVINGDIFTDFPLHTLRSASIDLAHLVLVKNPAHHPHGDFSLEHTGKLSLNPHLERYTFSGIGVYHPELFADLATGKAPLAPLLIRAINAQRISGELYANDWLDIGTEQRLAELEQRLHTPAG